MRKPKHALSEEDLARLAGVAEATWRLHKRAGCPVPKNKADLQRWLAAYKEWRETTRKKSGPVGRQVSDREQQSMERWRLFKAKKAELEFQIQAGNYIHRRDVEERTVRQILTVKQLHGELVRAARRLHVEVQDPDDFEAKLREQVDDLCNAFADGLKWPRPQGGTSDGNQAPLLDDE